MADETAVIEQPTDTTPVTPEPTPDPSPAPTTDATPHPLEPGGKRFNEVYAEKKALEREVAVLRETMQRPAATPTPTPAPPPPQFYTVQQLQAAVNAGQITHETMLAQIEWQAAEKGAQAAIQRQEHASKQQTVQQETERYFHLLPELNDATHPKTLAAQQACREVAARFNLPASDPRVINQALREQFGAVSKLEKDRQTREAARQQTDLHAETGGSAGGGRNGGGSGIDAAVKKINPDAVGYVAAWREQGKSEAEMLDLARYVRRPMGGRSRTR